MYFTLMSYCLNLLLQQDFFVFLQPTLVTNVASYCGYTDSHYSEYVQLKQEFGDSLNILAFPCNQFGEQEPEVSLFTHAIRCYLHAALLVPYSELLDIPELTYSFTHNWQFIFSATRFVLTSYFISLHALIAR